MLKRNYGDPYFISFRHREQETKGRLFWSNKPQVTSSPTEIKKYLFIQSIK